MVEIFSSLGFVFDATTDPITAKLSVLFASFLATASATTESLVFSVFSANFSAPAGLTFCSNSNVLGAKQTWSLQVW